MPELTGIGILRWKSLVRGSFLILATALLAGQCHADDTGDPIEGKIRIVGGASPWANVESASDSVPIELYDTKDLDHISNSGTLTDVDGFDSANWSSTLGTCVPSMNAVSIAWKATGGSGGTGACTVTASLYDKTTNPATDDAANCSLTIQTNAWKLTGIMPATRAVLYKGQGEVTTFTAVTDPATGVPADKITWAANGGTPATGTGMTFTWTQDASFVSSAVDDVITSCEATGGGGKKESKTTIVNIDKIQYKKAGTWTDLSGTLYVVTGTSVDFKAIKKPAAAPWPSGKPVWAGTAGATGTGETKSVAFSTLSTSTSDFKTVTAECGDTSAPANVVVFDFEGKLTPKDNCKETLASPRSKTKYGIGEEVDLDFTTTPTGITAAQAGGLTWSKSGGTGDLTPNAGAGTGKYLAASSPTSESFKLTVDSGPSQGKQKSYDRSVIKPTALHDHLLPGTAGTTPPSGVARFQVGTYFEPTDVSFSNCEFREGEAIATVANGKLTGYYVDWFIANASPAVNSITWSGATAATVEVKHNFTSPVVAVGAGDVAGADFRVDSISSGISAVPGKPFAAGSYDLDIPQQIRVKTSVRAGSPWHTASTFTHQGTCEATGIARVSKGAVGLTPAP